MVPKCGVLVKREHADLTARVAGSISLTLPFLSAPMDSVTETEMAVAMARLGGLGVLHRFCSIEEQVKMFYDAMEFSFKHHIKFPVGCAIGIHDWKERIQALVNNGCNLFVLDVAHAHTESVMDVVYAIKDKYKTEILLIVGNIATAQAAKELEFEGADGFKVGIGPGAACSTRIVTGFGVPQLTAIMDVRTATDLPIIADGGIKNSGDVVKALAAGADTVMLGRLLAGADESPHPGHYWGMASKKVNGHHAPEGVEGIVSLSGPVKDTIRDLAWGLRSGVSYAGAKNLQELRENAEFIRVSPLAQLETSTRL